MMSGNRSEKSAFIAASTFYVLVAFEFFYMASPFAAYFYGVYGPGLGFAQNYGPLNWVVRFFMPHLARDTTSLLINIHEHVGLFLFIGGLAAFFMGVVQIYGGKLRGRKEVTGWLYKHIRHPQYLALMISGFGMVLVWPRYLVLIAFVTMVIIYALLARAEELICLKAFPGYGQYQKTTGMFLPRRWEGPFRWFPQPHSRFSAAFIWIGGYAVALALATGLAFAVNAHAIRSLYGVFQDDVAIVSLGEIDQATLDATVALILADAEVVRVLDEARKPAGGAPKIIGYVLPSNFFVSEIPMELPPGEHFGHAMPDWKTGQSLKVILAQALVAKGIDVKGRDIVAAATNKIPLLEIHVETMTSRITRRLAPPEAAFYGGMPVPLF